LVTVELELEGDHQSGKVVRIMSFKILIVSFTNITCTNNMYNMGLKDIGSLL